MFHFAWVDAGETTFDPGLHAREDEQVFALAVEHEEGAFATAEVEIANPGQGLLNPARKLHAWIGVDRPGGAVPVFFGRVTGLPDALEGETIRLALIGQFPGWEAARAAAFAAAQSLPDWDPAFIGESERGDPDTLAEVTASRWHFDRLSGAVSLSDELDGDAVVDFATVLRDSLAFSPGEPPARRVKVVAEVEWEQRIRGARSVGGAVAAAFGLPKAVNSFTADAIERGWPRVGQGLGGESGYTVIRSRCRRYEEPPPSWPATSPPLRAGLTDAERRVAGAAFGGPRDSADRRLPRAWFDTDLWVLYDWRQRRRERLGFTIVADVQAVAFGDDGGTADLDFRAEDIVGLGLIPAASSSYFLTARGRRSVEHLLHRARALLRLKAAPATVKFQVPLADALGLSCRLEGRITDPRLPGGVARGKIVHYRLEADGDRGEAVATVTLRLAVGRNGSVAGAVGSGTWATAAYAGPDWQVFSGGSVALGDDLAYRDYAEQAPADPAVVARLKAGAIIVDVTVVNGPADQLAHLTASQYPARLSLEQALQEVPTEIALTMLPIPSGDVIDHAIEIAVPDSLRIPRGIDLEA